MTVGNNVRIGANCVVATDIPDNSTVVMPLPRIINHEEARDNTFVKMLQRIMEMLDYNDVTVCDAPTQAKEPNTFSKLNRCQGWFARGQRRG